MPAKRGIDDALHYVRDRKSGSLRSGHETGVLAEARIRVDLEDPRGARAVDPEIGSHVAGEIEGVPEGRRDRSQVREQNGIARRELEGPPGVEVFEGRRIPLRAEADDAAFARL